MRRRKTVSLFLAVWLPFFVWWLALRPGGLWIDSFSVWQQVQTGQWSNHHPAPFVAAVWLTSLGGRSVASVTFVQALLVASALFTFASALSRHWRLGATPFLAAAALGWLPLIAPFSLILQKDAWELAALLMLGAQLLGLTSPHGPGLTRRCVSIVVLSSLGATLFRWNGAATVGIAAVVALPGLVRAVRWRVFAALTASAACGVAILLAIPHVSSVQPTEAIDTHAQMLADLGTYAADDPGAFTPGDIAVLERLAPFREWQRQGSTGCDTVNYVVYRLLRAGGQAGAVSPNLPALSGVWRHLLQQSPMTAVRARLCRAALAWSPVSLDGRHVLTLVPGVRTNRLNIHDEPVLLGSVARRWADVSARNRAVQAIGWRPIGWLVLAVTLLLLRPPAGGRRREVLASIAVPLGVVLSFAVEPAAQDARYTYPAVVICQLYVVGMLVARLRQSPPPGGAATETCEINAVGSTISK